MSVQAKLATMLDRPWERGVAAFFDKHPIMPRSVAAIVVSYATPPTMANAFGKGWFNMNRTLKSPEEQENETPQYMKDAIAPFRDKELQILFFNETNSSKSIKSVDTTRQCVRTLTYKVFCRIVDAELRATGKLTREDGTLPDDLSWNLWYFHQNVFSTLQTEISELLTVYDLPVAVMSVQEAPDFKTDKECDALVKRGDIQEVLKKHLDPIK